MAQLCSRTTSVLLSLRCTGSPNESTNLRSEAFLPPPLPGASKEPIGSSITHHITQNVVPFDGPHSLFGARTIPHITRNLDRTRNLEFVEGVPDDDAVIYWYGARGMHLCEAEEKRNFKDCGEKRAIIITVLFASASGLFLCCVVWAFFSLCVWVYSLRRGATRFAGLRCLQKDNEKEFKGFAGSQPAARPIYGVLFD
jgi:hypothetical protein